MKNIFIACAGLIIATSSLFAEQITVYNKTHYPLWVSVYSQNDLMHHQTLPPQLISQQSSFVLECPLAHKESLINSLAISYSPSLFLSTMNQDQWKKIVHKRCSYFYEKTFYIERVNGILAVYNSLEWHITHPFITAFNYVENLITHPIEDSIDDRLPAIEYNPHAHHGAFIREGNQSHPGERLYVQKRKQKVRAALEKVLQQSVNDEAIPTISCAFSGGGLRAAVGTLGYLSALEKSELLDAIMFGSFVSGSCWSYAGWCARGGSLDDYKKEFFSAISKGIIPKTQKEIELIGKALLVKIIQGQPVTLVDIFGLLVGNVLFGYYAPDPHQCYMSHALERVRDGQWMMPIYTAIHAQEYPQGMWYEFTPYETGSSWLGKYVPTWAFGRQCVDGQSIDYAPEQSLGYILGLCASAFAAEIQEIYETFKNNINSVKIRALLEELLKPVANERLTYAQVHNFSAGMYKNALPQFKFLHLADAGTYPGFNFPYPPITKQRPERDSDIIIFFNMGIDVSPGDSLLAAQKYARTHNLKFPPIDISSIEQDSVTVFKDVSDTTVPVLIYIPLINDPALWYLLDLPEYSSYKSLVYNFDIKQCVTTGICETFQTYYDQYTSEQIAALAEFNLRVHKERIVDEIKAVMERKMILNKG